jgi:hypothetical protein
VASRKQLILDQIRAAQNELLTAIAGLDSDAMLRAGAVGIWSVKDVIAHLTVWQSELITALSQLDRRGIVPNIVKIDDLDEFNEEQYRINVRRGLDVIVEDLHGVHKHLLAAIEALDERTLTDSRKFAWLEGETLESLIAENGYWHESEHAAQIREWRTVQGL